MKVKASTQTCPVGVHFQALNEAILVHTPKSLRFFSHFMSHYRAVPSSALRVWGGKALLVVVLTLVKVLSVVLLVAPGRSVSTVRGEEESGFAAAER